MIDAKTFARYAKDPAAFRDDLLVDADGSVKRFGDVQDEWQKQDFTALDPALKRAAGRSDEPAKMRAYLERPRGHSKTTDLAVTAVWALTFGPDGELEGLSIDLVFDQALHLLQERMEAHAIGDHESEPSLPRSSDQIQAL